MLLNKPEHFEAAHAAALEMSKIGSHFAGCLGDLFLAADAKNQQKLVDAFPDTFDAFGKPRSWKGWDKIEADKSVGPDEHVKVLKIADHGDGMYVGTVVLEGTLAEAVEYWTRENAMDEMYLTLNV